MIIVILHKVVQRAVNGIILAGLHLNGNSGEAIVIVDQIINLAFAAVIVIVQVEAVGDQFAGNNTFIDRSKVDAPLIFQNKG